ncbi:unnamed protein product, partial [Symbiodinium sp. KB8]
QAFKELVQYRLQAVRDADRINDILLSSWQIVFGSQPRPWLPNELGSNNNCRRMQLRDDDHKLAGPDKEPTLVIQYFADVLAASFARLNVALKRTSKLSLRGKIRLWNAVVHSTLRYGITCTGFDFQGMQKYRALFMRHLRAICGSPVHLTRESNEALLVRAGVDCPLYTLVSQTAGRHRITAAQEVFKVQPPALAELWSQVLASIRPGDQGQDSSPAQQQHRMTHADLTQELHSDSPPLPVIASLPDEATAPVTSPTTLEHPQVLQVAGKTSTVAMSPDRHTPPADVVPALNNIDTAAGATQPNDPAPITHPPPTNAQLDAPAPPTADSPAAFAHADFQCPVCAYRAENTSALRYHMNVKHGLSERQMAFESIESFRFEDHAFAGMPTCKHCMRSFTGVPQLRNHIVAQVCPKLHGVTQPAKAPVPQPALPSASDVNCEVFTDAFQGANKRSSPGPLEERPSQQPKGKGRGKHEDQGLEGFGSNLGYMTQVQELQQQVDQMSRLLHRHELEIMTLKDRLAKMEETPDLLAHVRKLGWHHPTDSQWLHLRWSQEREQLIPEEPQRMFPHAALSSHLDSILEILEEDKVLHQFNATRRFNDQTDSTVMFFIRVSLQEQKAQLLFQRLLALCGLG